MSSFDSSADDHKDVEIQGQSVDFDYRHNIGATSISKNVKGSENLIHSQDEETMELYSRARAQEKEILYLRERIALASVKESQLLSEKYTLERKFAELRMALDEKQSEVITSASNELARRKGDLEVNLNLVNELKVVENEKLIFMSSMLEILGEYGAWPHVTNASALSNSIKQLHDQLQSKIRTSQARLADVNSMIGENAQNGFVDKDVPILSPMNSQLPSIYMVVNGFSTYSHHISGKHLEDDMSRFVQENDPKLAKSLMQDGEMCHLPNNESLLRTSPDIDRNFAHHVADNMLDRIGFHSGSEGRTADQFADPPMMHDKIGSFGSEEEGPGIEGFEIIGVAKPGSKLLGCGFPVRGTSLCMFQWVRYYPNGSSQYIEGATNPEYVVTADDVDKLIAVECIPMDEQGRQGDLVRTFANDNNKITCDDEMQKEIDAYISSGLAKFNVLILLHYSENWEHATLFLRRSGFQVNVGRKMDVAIMEKYSKDVLIKIPSGPSAQFVLTCSNGSSYPFSTNNDIRLRDTLVLTMRIFQNKVRPLLA